ncbi:Increased rDNA silencing protein [Parahypoxylon ruwenzoriense]
MNGSGSPNRSRLPPHPPGGHDDSSSSHDAALKGASLAFQKSTPKPPPMTIPVPRNHDNGALIAATSASRDHSRIASRQTTGSSIQGEGSGIEVERGMTSQHVTQYLQPSPQRNHNSSPHPGLANKQTMADPRSPSFIAATLAASRSVSPIHQQTSQSHIYTQQPARRQRKASVSANSSYASSVTSLDLVTDTTSIPSTNTLISMFERKDVDTDPIKKGSVEASENRKPVTPKPKSRSLTPSRAMAPGAKDELSPSRLASSRAWGRAASPLASGTNVVQEIPSQSQNVVVASKGRAPTPPPARTKHEINVSAHSEILEVRGKPRASTPPKLARRAGSVILSPQPRRSTSQNIVLHDVQGLESVARSRVSPPSGSKPQHLESAYEPPGSSLPPDTMGRSSASSDETFVSASSVPDSPCRGRSRPPAPSSAQHKRPHSSPNSVPPNPPPARSPVPPRRQQATSNLPLESLTNAIVAGSLASSRITPSAGLETPPPPPPRKKQTNPPMRQTLRQPPTKSDDEEGSRARSRRRKSLGKLGPGNKHAHHEGARKRWREEITLRERKRYEGVWASNRGLLLLPVSLPPEQSDPISHKWEKEQEQELSQVVANVVVRDIWARSRLPPDELAEVWDLVDGRGKGYLDKTEFVIGMWLIDQRLRGRKIPRKVSESVWGSASARGVRVGVHGLKGGK